jgi:hypothetical protein
LVSLYLLSTAALCSDLPSLARTPRHSSNVRLNSSEPNVTTTQDPPRILLAIAMISELRRRVTKRACHKPAGHDAEWQDSEMLGDQGQMDSVFFALNPIRPRVVPLLAERWSHTHGKTAHLIVVPCWWRATPEAVHMGNASSAWTLGAGTAPATTRLAIDGHRVDSTISSRL